MKLGILVNTDTHLIEIIGLTKAAVERGHDITVFTMDSGTRLFKHTEYSDLCRLSRVKMSFCDLNAKLFNAPTDDIPEEVVCGSQFDNATMMHECDKVIIL